MSPTGSLADPLVVSSSNEGIETPDDHHPITLSPQSPPDHERGHQPLEYVPKSPVYPPPNDNSETSEQADDVTPMMAPADVNADMDQFGNTERQYLLRQQLNKELDGAPWNKDASKQVVEQMVKVVKTVKPAYEGFWTQNDSDILSQLNEAA